MPPLVITILKVAFLGLLYVFIYRAFRSVVVELRPPAKPRQQRTERSSTAPPPTRVRVLDDSGSEVETVPLEGGIQIGRADACRIKATDTFVSAFHARLFRKDDAWFVEDMGSTNGTFRNGDRVTGPTEVRSGDRVTVGKTTLELRA